MSTLTFVFNSSSFSDPSVFNNSTFEVGVGELKAGTEAGPLCSFPTHNGVSLVFLLIGKSPEWLSCPNGMKRMVKQPLGPSKILALTSMKVLEIPSEFKISQSVKTYHIGGM